MKEELHVAKTDARRSKSKSNQVINVLRQETSASKMEAFRAEVKIDVMKHQLQQAASKAKTLERRLSQHTVANTAAAAGRGSDSSSSGGGGGGDDSDGLG